MDNIGTVPDTAVTSTHTKLPAVIVPLLKLVTAVPVVVFVTVVPPVTTAVPVSDTSDPYRILKVTEGVLAPCGSTVVILLRVSEPVV
jgi:hypothetical protein